MEPGSKGYVTAYVSKIYADTKMAESTGLIEGKNTFASYLKSYTY
jgi:hypothetical protein